MADAAVEKLLVSVWGKGGVGKSTVAATLSHIYSRMGFRVALVSTDIFPSILELLGGGEPGRWQRLCGFDVLVVSEEWASREWRRRFGDQVYTVLSTLFNVDRETILSYLETAPWVLEQLHMLTVVEALENHDIVVWDTAGAGGGLQALMLEEKLYRHLRMAPRLYSRFALKGHRLDELIAEWRRLAERILETLSTKLHKPVIVTDVFSGAWPVYELESYISRVAKPQAVIVNRFVEPGCSCRLCSSLARLSRELVDKLAGHTRVYTLRLLEEPPRGCKGLEALERDLEELAHHLLSQA